MALTNAQRASIRLYLGYQSRFYQVDTQLEQAMLAVGDADTDTLALLAGILASLQDIDTKLVDAHARLKAKKVGSIELMEDRELMTLRSEGRRFAGRLSAMLGVSIRSDAFSGAGPSIDGGDPNCGELCIG